MVKVVNYMSCVSYLSKKKKLMYFNVQEYFNRLFLKCLSQLSCLCSDCLLPADFGFFHIKLQMFIFEFFKVILNYYNLHDI